MSELTFDVDAVAERLKRRRTSHYSVIGVITVFFVLYTTSMRRENINSDAGLGQELKDTDRKKWERDQNKERERVKETDR